MFSRKNSVAIVFRDLIIRLLLILLSYGLAAIASGVVVGLVFAIAEASAANDIAGIIVFAIVML